MYESMAANREVSLSSLYAELSRFGQKEEYERALKTANKILQQKNDEQKAFHCKIICLIQLSKFQDALKACAKEPKLSASLIFEKAYCQYRLNLPQEALKTVDSDPEPSLKLKELRAQILYRLERFQECFDVYRDVIKNSSDENENERETNLFAVVANLCAENPSYEAPQLREDTYELSYNAVCQLIGRGLYQEAEKKLKTTEKLCRETFEEDDADADVEEELSIIRVQLAYCMQMQGREKEAQAIYLSVLKQKHDDVGLVAIASNNLVAINRDQNVFDSKKRMRSATLDTLEHKLNSRQRRDIALNQCLLALYTNQGEQCQQLCARLVSSYPDMQMEATLIQAVQLSREGKTREAVALLTGQSGRDPELNLAMKLAAVQLLLAEGERKESCRILESLGEATFKPGIISALVTLYLADKNRDGASKVLKDAVDWYRKNKVSAGDLSAMWRQAADFHLRGGEPAVAAQSLEELLRINPGDRKTLAQLVIAYAKFDPAKAQSLSKQLPPLSLPQNADIDALETSNWVMRSKVAKKTAAKVEQSPSSKPGTPGNELIQKKTKRKKKGKLPKNYDPSVTPDPERWLPRHERTGYRKKKDRRNKDKDILKGTQGAATGASDMYDITKMQSQQKPSPNPSSPAPESSGPRQQLRKAQMKKKKKGGKW